MRSSLLILVLCYLTSCGWSSDIRHNPKGAAVEESIESLAESSIELAAPVDIDIDIDPAGNLRKKCKHCSIHCPEEKESING